MNVVKGHSGMNFKRHNCPICRDTITAIKPFLNNSVREEAVTSASFASRKLPEYMSHAIVRCTQCDLVYVDRPPSQEQLADNYHAADYDSSEEAEHAADSYAKAIRPVLDSLAGRMNDAPEIREPPPSLHVLRMQAFAMLSGSSPQFPPSQPHFRKDSRGYAKAFLKKPISRQRALTSSPASSRWSMFANRAIWSNLPCGCFDRVAPLWALPLTIAAGSTACWGLARRLSISNICSFFRPGRRVPCLSRAALKR